MVLESTTYPGTVDEVVRPRLEAGGLRAGRDFCLAFSPERIDPGNREWTTRNIPRVVGGIDARSTEAAAALYRHIVEKVVPVSSPRVAAMVKLLENTFRAVNIGMVNELALMCRDLDVNVWEVIDAARTKPFGFMPFYPGPGLGGHCIPVDPFYLSWKARQHGFEPRFIELAGQVNGAMPRYVVERIAEALNTRSRALRGARVHLFGVAYKANVSDTRESPVIDIADLLQQRGAIVSYSDPLVPFVNEGTVSLEAIAPVVAFDAGIDCAVITTAHDDIDYAEVARRAPLVVDTRNVLRGVEATQWDTTRPDAPVLWDSTIRLGEEFFNEIIRHPLPLDLNILKALKRSPLGLDLYFWLVYRTFSLKGPLRLSWKQLYQQFGSNPARASEANTVPDFRKDCLRELKKINLGLAGPALCDGQGRAGALAVAATHPTGPTAPRGLAGLVPPAGGSARAFLAGDL